MTYLSKLTAQVRLAGFDRLIAGALIIWVLAMISLPIARWIYGDGALPWGISLGVLLQVIAVLVTLLHSWGWRRTLITVTAAISAAWLVEYIGHTTGFPFGGYDYTDRLQPQLGGVPLLVPLAWMMMLPPAWAVAGRLTRAFGLRGRVSLALAAALAFTAWDLFLDPQMVAWGLWVWDDPGTFNYFGIPWVNYGGWLLASALITLLASAFGDLRALPVTPLLVIYAITWALQTIGQLFFWDLPGPALVGGVVMGALLLAAVRLRPRERQAA